MKQSIIKKQLTCVIAFLLCSIAVQSNCSDPYYNEKHLTLFENKNILILGGTGFIGRALTTEILKYNPKSIVIFSRDEVKHFNFINIFGNNPKIKHVIGSIRDIDCLTRATRGIDMVFHAAALKRMDDLERNVEEAIKTNILGSINVFNACVANNVPKVLFISTDKACSPINIYGACKFASEKIFTNYDQSHITTQFIVARYGNILESTGSVIPIFTDKILKGEAIPLTDPEMTRFILDKHEAIDLIFDALHYGTGGEIFSKKTISFKITDLIEILKTKFKATNPVKIIGLRPGEKIHEMLVNESEMARTFEYKNCYIIYPSVRDMSKTGDDELPFYITRGKKLAMHHFSSDQTLLTQDEVSSLFKKFGLL
ncbi:MAG: polysaccharide biosynthesis protein [Candidatus Babeliales bacterium]|nr:polysaccharide biosynthesis protein [Candidatus Babeliales bacterium]